MQNYINQLIENLKEIAHKHKLLDVVIDEPVNDNETFQQHIEDVENYIAGKTQPISIITGVKLEELPPVEMLSEVQKEQLSKQLEKFLLQFRFVLEFPPQYPLANRYAFIRKFCSEERTLMKFGMCHIEFCNYDKKNCPFPEHCKCCYEFESEGDKPDINHF